LVKYSTSDRALPFGGEDTETPCPRGCTPSGCSLNNRIRLHSLRTVYTEGAEEEAGGVTMDAKMGLRQSISEAIDWGIENGILADFLKQNRSDVENMLMSEFSIDIAKDAWQEEAFLDGLKKGIEKSRADERRIFISILRTQGMSDEEIAKATGYTLDEI